MKDTTLKNKVSQKLQEFELLQDIEPSSGWNQSITDRLTTSKPKKAPMHPATVFAIIALFFVLGNIVLILNTTFKDTGRNLQRDNDLQVISKELLINSTSPN